MSLLAVFQFMVHCTHLHEVPNSLKYIGPPTIYEIIAVRLETGYPRAGLGSVNRRKVTASARDRTPILRLSVPWPDYTKLPRKLIHICNSLILDTIHKDL